jgi:hypothetical protein
MIARSLMQILIEQPCFDKRRHDSLLVRGPQAENTDKNLIN